MAGFTFQNVCKSYITSRGETIAALQGINLEVSDGEFVCIVGQSGCGKTSLLRVAAGLESLNGGRVLLGSMPVLRPNPVIGVVFQEDRLLPWRTVRSNVELGLELRGIPKKERNKISEKYLRLVELESFADVLPHELSGGMKQRVAIARVLANEPEAILMDEPFGALDAQTRNQMQGELLRIWEQEARTVIFVTHSVDEAVVLADRVVVLTPRPGRIRCEYRLNLKRPRDRTSPEVIEHRRNILTSLHI